MNLQSTTGHGVNGTQVVNFSFTNGKINNASRASDHSCVSFDDLNAANASGTLTSTNNQCTQTEANGVDVENWGATLSDVNMSNNQFTDTGDVATPGFNANSAVGCAGIAVGTDDPAGVGAGTHTTPISGNNVTGTDGPGIFPIVPNSGSTMTARVTNNTVAAAIATNAARAGIRVDSGSAVGDTTLCLEISGNTTAGSTNTATATTSPRINLRKQGTDPAINTFGIEGLSPSPTGTPNVGEPREFDQHEYVRDIRGGRAARRA